MADNQLNILSAKIDDLVTLCSELMRESELLKADRANLLRENRELLEKNEQACEKVAIVVDRLRAVE